MTCKFVEHMFKLGKKMTEKEDEEEVEERERERDN